MNDIDQELYDDMDKHPSFAEAADREEFMHLFEFISSIKAELFGVLGLTEEEIVKLGAESGKFEKFILVDEDDNEIVDEKGIPRIAYRKNCHTSENREKFIHRASGYVVESADGRVYLSLRAADKDTYPSHWEIGGGHCGLNSYQDALDAEIGEELGISIEEVESKSHIVKFLLKDDLQTQYSNYTAVKLKEGVEAKMDEEELVELKLFTLEEIYEAIDQNKLKIMPHQKYVLLKFLKQKGIDTDELAERVKKEIANPEDGSTPITIEKESY